MGERSSSQGLNRGLILGDYEVPMRNFKSLASRLSSKKKSGKASIFVLADTDADLLTDDEKELLEDVADGKDPFERRQKERSEAIENQQGTEVHFSSLDITGGEGVRKAFMDQVLKAQAPKLAKYKPDKSFCTEHPDLHKFLMRVYGVLQDTEDMYEEIPMDPEQVYPAPRDPILRSFQSAYRSLKEAMDKLKEHFHNFGDVHDKWISLIQKRYTEFMPVYHALQEQKGEAKEEQQEQKEELREDKADRKELSEER